METNGAAERYGDMLQSEKNAISYTRTMVTQMCHIERAMPIPDRSPRDGVKASSCSTMTAFQTGQTVRQRHATHDPGHNFMVISENKNVMKLEQDSAIWGLGQTVQSIVTIGPGTLPNHHSQSYRIFAKEALRTPPDSGTPVLLGS